MAEAAAQAPSAVYHERQRWQLCGVHAVNNLLQRAAFSKADFDALCEEMDPRPAGLRGLLHFNAHRENVLGLGNFDVNVCLRALSSQDYRFRWFDARQRIVDRFPVAAAPKLQGFLVNEVADGFVSRLVGGRHWYAVREVAGTWLNLDSVLTEPRPFAGGLPATLEALQLVLERGGQVIEVWRPSEAAVRRKVAAVSAMMATAVESMLDGRDPARAAAAAEATRAAAAAEAAALEPEEELPAYLPALAPMAPPAASAV
jgi:josephin